MGRALRAADIGLTTTIFVVAIVLVYVQSRGGLAKLLSRQDDTRLPTIAINSTPEVAGPPAFAPSNPMGGTDQLFANPIAQADGGDGTWIPPMSATSFGAVQISPADLGNVQNRGRYFRDPDKGLVFVTLPEGVTKTGLPSHGDSGSTLPQAAGAFPDVVRAFRQWIQPSGAPLTPGAAQEPTIPSPRVPVSF